MPDMRDYLMFEIATVFEKQDHEKKVKKNTGKELSKVLADEKYVATNAEEEDDDSEEEEPRDGSQKQDEARFWESLEIPHYENKTQAEDISFKQFMQNHIRLYVPAVFKGLVVDEPAVKSWARLDYLMEKLEDDQVEGIHYLAEAEMKRYAPIHPF